MKSICQEPNRPIVLMHISCPPGQTQKKGRPLWRKTHNFSQFSQWQFESRKRCRPLKGWPIHVAKSLQNLKQTDFLAYFLIQMRRKDVIFVELKLFIEISRGMEPQLFQKDIEPIVGQKD